MAPGSAVATKAIRIRSGQEPDWEKSPDYRAGARSARAKFSHSVKSSLIHHFPPLSTTKIRAWTSKSQGISSRFFRLSLKKTSP